MQQENFSGKEFAPNRRKKNIQIIYWVCGFFILLGLAVSGGQFFSAGMLFAGFGLIMLLIGHFLTSPFRATYRIDRSGIYLAARKNSTKILYSEIESILELKENQAEEFMLRLKKKEEAETASIVFGGKGAELTVLQKIKEAFKAQANAFSHYKFLSVPIMYKSSGGRNNIAGVNLPCDAVFILLKNGGGYLISPLDAPGFVMEAKKQMADSN